MHEKHGSSGADPWMNLPSDWNPESRFDGGDTGCGEMILDLRTHFRKLPPGTHVAIHALDVGDGRDSGMVPRHRTRVSRSTPSLLFDEGQIGMTEHAGRNRTQETELGNRTRI